MPLSAPSPRPFSYHFFYSECDGGSAAEVSDLSEMMAALPPRQKASFYLCIYLFASFLIAET
jgi:hypothetical protein